MSMHRLRTPELARRISISKGAIPVTALFLACTTACVKTPKGRSPVDEVSVRGADKVSESDVEGKLATAPSPKFLYLFRGVVYDYEVFDQNTLQRDLARVERFYRAKGYYDAHARAGRVDVEKDNHVNVQVVVEEGPPTINQGLSVRGIEELPPQVKKQVFQAASAALPSGKPFEEDQFVAAETKVKKALTDAGYAYAKTTRDVYLDVVHHVANVVINTVPGETATFGAYTIDGLDPDGNGPRKQEIEESPLRRSVNIDVGQPYSTSKMDDAVQALLDLEVFSAVEIVPDLSHPETRVVSFKIHVEPTRLRQIRLGGGVELDEIKTEIHAITGWEDHNFFGGLRDFKVDFTPGVVLFPTRIDSFVEPRYLFPEEKLRVEFRQPGFIESRTTGFVRPEFNVYPLLVETDPDPSQPVVGYVEGKGAVGADRQTGKLFTSLSYDVQVEDPFSYKGGLDPDLHTLLIAYPELVNRLEFVDNHSHPRKGVVFANDFQIAGGPFGGSARDVKLQPEVRGYVPITPDLTFASRAALGFLWASNYGSVIQDNQLDTATTAANRAQRVSDIETVFFRGLYSGGPSSNRGFPIRGIAPHGVVPFLNPATASQQVQLNCTPTAANHFNPDPSECSIPIGGFTLWEWSDELRIHVKGPLSTVAFCDMGDVSPQENSIRLSHLHLSCGVGVRYDTPVGPIRVDVGYRIQPAQILGYASQAAYNEHHPEEGVQPNLLPGLPIALAIGIGEAY
jgi:outer membrane protein insertion porin family/translocation and assembly module TamA